MHVEALDEADLKRAVAQIHEAGLLAAAALKPKTPASALSPVIAELDMALVMSVEPGFSGQSYIAGSDWKVAEVVQMARAAGNEELLIQVDGGIGLVNAWYYEHYGGILSSAGVHMLNNLVSYLMM